MSFWLMVFGRGFESHRLHQLSINIFLVTHERVGPYPALFFFNPMRFSTNAAPLSRGNNNKEVRWKESAFKTAPSRSPR